MAQRTACCGLSAEQLVAALSYVVMVAANAASAAASAQLGLQSNADLTRKRKTAFTPAGYAFAIWSVIYTLGAVSIVWSTRPSKRDWVDRRVRWAFITNFLANAAWLPLFQAEVGGLWVSAVVIAGILLPTLIYVHRRLGIGSGAGGLQSARESHASAFELVFVHSFVSVYMGWLCVATIANIALALTPPGTVADLGWTAAGWSIVMQCVAAALAAAMMVLHGDAAFAAPIAWALLAIGVQQRDDEWPGGDGVVRAAYALGGALWFAIAIVAVVRTARRFCCRRDSGDLKPLMEYY